MIALIFFIAFIFVVCLIIGTITEHGEKKLEETVRLQERVRYLEAEKRCAEKAKDGAR